MAMIKPVGVGWPTVRALSRATPIRLQIGLWLVWLLCAAAVILAVGSVLDARRTAQTIGFESAPAIVAALEARSDLADGDANVANYLVATGDRNIQSAQDLERDLDHVLDRMVTIAQTISSGNAEREPLTAMHLALRSYLEDWGQARELHRFGEDVRALVVYRDATFLMREKAFPAAEQQVKVSYDRMQAAYDAQSQRAGQNVARILTATLLLLGLLVGLQLFLAKRYRRTFNPLLIGASVLVLCFGVLTTAALARATNDLRNARQDVFESINTLWTVRALAFDTNADESRWLLDREWADRYATAFNEKSALIARGPNDEALTPDQLTDLSHNVDKTPFKGYLHDLVANGAIPGGREASTRVLTAYAQYMALDGEMRAVQQSGDHEAAMALKISQNPGQLNWAFLQFDKSLEDAISIAQRGFDGAVRRSIEDVQGYDYLAVIALLAVAALTWLGLRPRLREYSA